MAVSRKCAAAVVAALVLGLLSACAANFGPSVALTNLPPDEAARVTQGLASESAARQLLAGTTALSISGGYGTQIEYLSANGTSGLWFPGSPRTTPGHWKVESNASGGLSMCFLYGADSYDPVQKTYGGNWECGPLTLYLGHLLSLAEGDPFKLSSGRPPFVMPAGAFTLEQAQANAAGKVSQRPLTYVFNRLVPQ